MLLLLILFKNWKAVGSDELTNKDAEDKKTDLRHTFTA